MAYRPMLVLRRRPPDHRPPPSFEWFCCRSRAVFKLSTEQGPALDVSGTPVPSIRTPKGSTLGGQIIPQLSLEDLPSTRILKYSKRMEPLRPIERHLHVVQPSRAVLMQLTPSQRQGIPHGQSSADLALLLLAPSLSAFYWHA